MIDRRARSGRMIGARTRFLPSGPPLLFATPPRGHVGLKSLYRLWAGELPLREAFWTWAVAGALAVNIVTSLLFLTLVTLDRPILALIIGYGCSVPYNVVALVGVWRAADRHRGDPGLVVAARIVATVGLAILSLT
jgi:hypothetical protein